jgi:hypothetical protein
MNTTAKKSDPLASKNQGEGNVEAARRYNDEQKRFVESGAVTDAAERAEPATDAEARELLDAEQTGLKKTKGEDPTVPGANARTKTKVGRQV